MKVPAAFVTLGLATLLALTSWTLREVVNLKVQVAALSTALSAHTGAPAIAKLP